MHWCFQSLKKTLDIQTSVISTFANHADRFFFLKSGASVREHYEAWLLFRCLPHSIDTPESLIIQILALNNLEEWWSRESFICGFEDDGRQCCSCCGSLGRKCELICCYSSTVITLG